MAKMKALDWVAIVLLVVGGLNWGLVGAFGFNLVNFLFGSWAIIERIIYGLVGASSLYSMWSLFKLSK